MLNLKEFMRAKLALIELKARSRKWPGITEQFWSSTSKDLEFRLAWGFFTKAFAGLMSLFIATRTGITSVDICFGTLSGALPLLFIAGQRDFSRFRPLTRYFILRISIGATVAAVTLVGMALYIAMIYGLVKGVVPAVPWPRFVLQKDELNRLIFSTALLCTLPVAAFNVFRGVQFEAMIHDVPKQELINLLVRRKFIATDLLSFAIFELGVIMVSGAYGSTVLAVVNIIRSAPST